MVHPYLNRRAGREPVVYAHPSLEPILRRTLGVPLFQEQLLRMAMVAAGFTGGQAEELRRAMGFKRSEKRMRVIEQQLREGMARQGITGEAAEQIITSIASFALYGFPESHAASFAHIAYASAYLKAHYPAAFFTALLNNQPMGFYHPATLVKDAQRHGVHFAPVDVEISDWDCTIDADGRVRLGLRYVGGLREQVGRAIAGTVAQPPPPPSRCPKCGCDDRSMLGSIRNLQSAINNRQSAMRRGNVFATPAPTTGPSPTGRRASSARPRISSARPARAATSSPCWPRSARWRRSATTAARRSGRWRNRCVRKASCSRESAIHNQQSAMVPSPLSAMTAIERMTADFAGTGLTIGPHPMSFHRAGAGPARRARAVDLARPRPGRRVRVAGCVITRQRPGTAKGFVFLTLEDETGISNIIVRPAIYDEQRLAIIESSFVLVEGLLQHQDGVVAVQAERVQRLDGVPIEVESHEFQ